MNRHERVTVKYRYDLVSNAFGMENIEGFIDADVLTSHGEVHLLIKADLQRAIFNRLKHEYIIRILDDMSSVHDELTYGVYRKDSGTELFYTQLALHDLPHASLKEIENIILEDINITIISAIENATDNIYEWEIYKGSIYYGAYEACVTMQLIALRATRLKDVFRYLLCPMIWETRRDDAWTAANATKKLRQF